jgi:hypothetical protein
LREEVLAELGIHLDAEQEFYEDISAQFLGWADVRFVLPAVYGLWVSAGGLSLTRKHTIKSLKK